MAVLSLVFGALAVRDIRTGYAGFVIATLRKWENPVTFWGLVAAEALAALLCAGIAVAAFTMPATCDEAGVCTVVIETASPPEIPCPKEGCRALVPVQRPPLEPFP
ncbi:hypothetical protein [Erythrobacter colymbi]|uniref:hypothetical protein n=1 Tax=Erythrobacter colymbi TaxID=1161202 RepID=UPI00117E4249|nr:hypothetical protein [Erythrobacter colymbi]